jgi:hypothetical protein
MKTLYFDDICYDIYLETDIIFDLEKQSFYKKAAEILTTEQHKLFIQGEREFEQTIINL